MITYVQIFGSPQPKSWEGKNIYNLAQFWTTFNFDGVYFRNRNQSRYRKVKTNISTAIPTEFSKENLVNFGSLAK